MIGTFGKLTANQRVWGAIGSVVVGGTVFKVSVAGYINHDITSFRF